MKPRAVVDTRGSVCPVPVIRIAETLRNLEPGSVVELLGDDPAIEVDLRAWCWSNGHTIRESHREGNVRRFLVEKGQAPRKGRVERGPGEE